MRLATIEAAGQASVPYTSGILIGIGETRLERIESLLALRDLHQQYGHIQVMPLLSLGNQDVQLFGGPSWPSNKTVLRMMPLRISLLQELIIQNFVPKKNTAMANIAEPPFNELLWTVAVARLLFGPDMNIQAPPNLTPGELRDARNIESFAGIFFAALLSHTELPNCIDCANPLGST